ncbi:MAG: WhiB family transcriptional regulator [Streptosporangiaceae bacterium]
MDSDRRRPGGSPVRRDLIPREDWREYAACRAEDPELFFPIGSTGPAALEQTAQAKAVCARCPVRAACLAYALRTGQDFGIWGGLTSDGRRALRARQSMDASLHG